MRTKSDVPALRVLRLARAALFNNTITDFRAGVAFQVRANNPNAGATQTTSPGINLRKQGTDPNVNTFGIERMAATSSPGVENYVNSLNTFGVGGTALLSAQSGFTNCTAP